MKIVIAFLTSFFTGTLVSILYNPTDADLIIINIITFSLTLQLIAKK